MDKNNLNPKPGKILISEPVLHDFYFNRSVVLLAEHSDETGSMGMIINKPLNLKLSDVGKEFPNVNFPVYMGGPVNPDRLFYLHTFGEKIPGAIKIMDGLYWGGEIKKLIEYIELGMVSHEQVRFFIGYSGWQPDQLKNELEKDAWIVSDATLDTIMAKNPEQLWKNMLQNLGDDYAIWANSPADPMLN